MEIKLQNVGKKYQHEWIFRKFSYTFTKGGAYAIVGPNGSGKSTLLQVLAGSLTASEGTIVWTNGSTINPEKIYSYISLTAPYLDLIDEMTPIEFLQFHNNFKPLISTQSINSILDIINLKHVAQKQMRYFSSGMKQRLKLAQAIFSDTPILLLDEPCMNLDKAGIDLYQQLVDTYAKDKLIIVSSNHLIEYSFCKEIISIKDFKVER